MIYRLLKFFVLIGKFVELSAMLFRDTPYGGILWFRYISELTASINVPPRGFLIGTALTQSNGKFATLQIIGWTFCCKFSEMAAMAHVSVLTATRLRRELKQRVRGIEKRNKGLQIHNRD